MNASDVPSSAAGGREWGAVTLFVVLVSTALFLGVAGLVFDGGRLLTTKRQAMNEAEQAARAGAQGLAVEEVHGGGGAGDIDPARAQAAAQAYLDALGHRGTVSVSGNRVSVSVQIPESMEILPFGTVTVSATAQARNARGVVSAES